MAIPEAQLETWAKRGSVTQSADTYGTIRKVLNDSASPYYPKDFSVFLQGSYGNETNILIDSDVDIIIRLDETYCADTTALAEGAKANYTGTFTAATYGYDEFKADVLAWLQKEYGDAVVPGKKAIFIKGDGNRRDADVLVCNEHRRYLAASTGVDELYEKGICFWSGSIRIENYPKQHADNCTTKNQDTDQWFKRMVRVYKNMRNRMIDDGYIDEGVAPSYFLEGMLWSVPNEHFGTSYEDSFINTYNWLIEADRSNLACANDLFWLVRDNSRICWPTSNFDAYLTAAGQYWRDWDA